MKFLLSLAVLCLVNVNVYTQLNSGWVWQNPLPQGNNLTDIVFSGTNIGYACGNYGALVKSTDGSNNWNLIRDTPNKYFRGLYKLNDNTLFADLIIADSNRHYIAKSTDGGLTWERFTHGSNFAYFSFDFVNANTGYVCCTDDQVNKKIYKTTDSGTNWLFVATLPLPVFTFNFLDETTAYAVGSDGYISKTTNGGINWIQTPTGTSATLYAVDIINLNRAVVVGQFGRVIVTTSGGSSWNVTQSVTSRNLYSVKFYNASNGAAVGDYGTVVTTTNAGDTWNLMNSGYTDHFTSCDNVNNNSLSIAGEGGVILKSQNNFQSLVNPLPGSRKNIRDLEFVTNTLGFAAGDSGLVMRTTNGGENWSVLPTPNTMKLIAIDFIDQFNGYAVGWGIVLKTTNGGNLWTSVNINGSGTEYQDVSFADLQNGYITTEFGVLYKTTNGGNTWQEISTQSGFYKMNFLNAATGYAFENQNGILYKTTNGGENWTARVLGESIYSFSIINENNIYVACDSRIFRTTNSGINWTLYLVPGASSIYDISFTDNFTGYLTCVQGHVFKTTNGGSSWGRVYRTNSGYAIECLDNNTCFVAGEDGFIIKTTTGGNPIGITQINSITPSRYSISQNYPNPFNPVTNIKFDIPSQSNVKIIIYDILGKEIAVLVNEEMNSGSYSVDWDASAYPSGVYFYKLVTDDFSESKKMVLVK